MSSGICLLRIDSLGIQGSIRYWDNLWYLRHIYIVILLPVLRYFYKKLSSGQIDLIFLRHSYVVADSETFRILDL